MKNDLINVTSHNKLTLNSRKVAEMMGIKHWEVLRKLEGSKDRKGYIQILNDNQMVVADYFIKSSYLDDKGEERPCYLLTKMGCEFLANKFTGEKGILFTAKYVQAFNNMEQSLKPACIEDVLIQSLQAMKEMKYEVAAAKEIAVTAKEDINNIKDTIITDLKDWRDDVNKSIKKIGAVLGDYRRAWNESYEHLEKRARCNLDRRLENYIQRLTENGASKKKINEACYLDVIDQDERLKQIYIAVVKEMSIRYAD